MIVLRKILPSSIESSYKEDYEYMLFWISPDVGVRQWFFSSTDGRREDKFKSEVIDTNNDYRSIPNQQDIDISLVTKSLSREDFDYVTSIFSSNRIYLVSKSGNKTPISIDRTTKRTQRVIKGFEVSLDITLQEPDLMNV